MDTKLLAIINELLTDIGLEEVQELKPTWSLKDDLQIDSISKAELVVKMNIEYGVDASLVETIGDIQKIISVNSES